MIYDGKNGGNLEVIDLENGRMLESVGEADTAASILTEFKRRPGGKGYVRTKRVCAFDIFDTVKGCVIDKGRP